MTAQTKISVLSTPKLAARDKRFKILFMVRSKKTQCTRPIKSGLNLFSRYLAKEKESRNIEAILLVNLTRTLLLHDSLQTKWRRAVRFVFDVKKLAFSVIWKR